MKNDLQKDIASLKIHNKRMESKIDKIMAKLGIEQESNVPKSLPILAHYNSPVERIDCRKPKL